MLLRHGARFVGRGTNLFCRQIKFGSHRFSFQFQVFSFQSGEVFRFQCSVFSRKTSAPIQVSNSVLVISSPSLPQKEERAGVRRPFISISYPLTLTLSPFGRGEGIQIVGLKFPSPPSRSSREIICIAQLKTENLKLKTRTVAPRQLIHKINPGINFGTEVAYAFAWVWENGVSGQGFVPPGFFGLLHSNRKENSYVS